MAIKGFCPDDRCYLLDLEGGFPQSEQGGLFVAAVSVGIAQRALDEIIALAAGGKRPLFSTNTLSASPLFQQGLGSADISLRAADALLREQATAIRNVTVVGQVARGRAYATAAQVTRIAKQVTTDVFELGGGSSVYQSCELQRAMRNVQAAGQHFLNSPFLVTRLGVNLLEAAHSMDAA